MVANVLTTNCDVIDAINNFRYRRTVDDGWEIPENTVSSQLTELMTFPVLNFVLIPVA